MVLSTPKTISLKRFCCWRAAVGMRPCLVFLGAILSGGRERIMLRGLKWLIGALLLAVGALLALNNICSNPSGESWMAGFFCPQPKKKVLGPSEPFPAPAPNRE